jgi:hypothetical protein
LGNVLTRRLVVRVLPRRFVCFFERCGYFNNTVDGINNGNDDDIVGATFPVAMYVLHLVSCTSCSILRSACV